MSTTEHRATVTRRIPILLLAVAGVAIILWLLGHASGKSEAPDLNVAETSAGQRARSAPEPAPASSDTAAPEHRNGSQDVAASLRRDSQASLPLTSMDADIPPYESQPADVLVEIGSPIDVDNPPVAIPMTPHQVTNLGPLLDADDEFNTVQNSSAEDVSIGDDMPVDE